MGQLCRLSPALWLPHKGGSEEAAERHSLAKAGFETPQRDGNRFLCVQHLSFFEE